MEKNDVLRLNWMIAKKASAKSSPAVASRSVKNEGKYKRSSHPRISIERLKVDIPDKEKEKEKEKAQDGHPK